MSELAPHAPNELERLLLRAALLEGDPAVEAWERSKHVADDIKRLDEASYRLLPQLYRNLRSLGVDDPLMGTLKGVWRHSWYCNQRLFHEAADSLRLLEANGIETIVIKGAALSVLHYRDPGARPMEDLDVVVRGERVHDAVRVLEEAGWRRTHPLPLRVRLRMTHSTEFEDTRGRAVDLHWNPLFETVPEEGFWRRAVPLTVGGAETHGLSPTDELLCTIMHGLCWYPAPVRWISDSVAIARTASEQGGIDWQAMAERAAEWSLTARLYTGLALLSSGFGVQVPGEVLESLECAHRPLSERAAQRALLRNGRTVPFVLHWDRYRRMRALGAPAARGGLPGYMRDAFLWGSWLTPFGVLWRRGMRVLRLRRA